MQKQVRVWCDLARAPGDRSIVKSVVNSTLVVSWRGLAKHGSERLGSCETQKLRGGARAADEVARLVTSACEVVLGPVCSRGVGRTGRVKVVVPKARSEGGMKWSCFQRTGVAAGHGHCSLSLSPLPKAQELHTLQSCTSCARGALQQQQQIQTKTKSKTLLHLRRIRDHHSFGGVEGRTRPNSLANMLPQVQASASPRGQRVGLNGTEIDIKAEVYQVHDGNRAHGIAARVNVPCHDLVL